MPSTTALASGERRRLEHRTRRMEYVIRALRERAAGYDRRGGAPAPLREAISGFSAELERDRRRLAGA